MVITGCKNSLFSQNNGNVLLNFFAFFQKIGKSRLTRGGREFFLREKCSRKQCKQAMQISESKAKLACALPSVRIVYEAKLREQANKKKAVGIAPTANVRVTSFHRHPTRFGNDQASSSLRQWSLHPLRFPRYRGTETPRADVQWSMVNVQCSMDEDVWYDLNGRKYTERPTKSGIYVHNGRKETVE